MTAGGDATDRRPVGPPGILGWLPWIAAFAALLAAGFLLALHWADRTEIAILHDQSGLAEVETKSLQQRLEAERIVAARRIADLTVDTQGLYNLEECALLPLHSRISGAPATAMVIWDPTHQQGTLIADGLPPPPAGREYRLWITDPRRPEPFAAGRIPLPESAGEVRFAFKSDRPVRGAPSFTVSLEASGPSAKPVGPTVLSSP